MLQVSFTRMSVNINKRYLKIILIFALLYAAAYCTLYVPYFLEMPRETDGDSGSINENKENPAEKPAANTGSVFSGDVLRTFSGAKRLREEVVASDRRFFLPLHPKSKLCEKWGVVTTINAPTESILTFAALKDWCLVVVADTKTPVDGYLQLVDDYSDGRIVFLSVQDQKDMAIVSPFVNMIPYKSFARKNIGYLFAIRHGAKAIFDFDDDNVLKEAVFSSTPRSPLFLLRDDDDDNGTIRDSTWIVRMPNDASNTAPLAFNPLPFMKPTFAEIWPRGFPLQDIMLPSSFTASTTDLRSIPRSKIAVVQATCDHDPDVDAIYRLTRPLPVMFDDAPATAMRLIVPSGRYAPYNAQATTHMYDAFWGLLLPFTVLGRVTDIWRSYFTQRILHDLSLAVVYSPPLVVHNRSVHNYIADLQAEQDLYMKTEKLLSFLSTWRDSSQTLPARIENLAIALYERDYIGFEDVLAMQEWLLALMDAGYKFPLLSTAQELSQVVKPMPVLHDQAFSIRPAYNLGGKEGDWKLYRDFIGSRSATADDWYEWLDGSKTYQEQNPSVVPHGIILSLVMMAKDEWPLLRNNVFYHGHLLGFENLYILDGSTDARCTSFLVFARDQLGVNVVFTPSGLNELASEMSFIGGLLAGSSDLVAKIDVDEFIATSTIDGTSCLDNSVGRSPQSCPISPLAMKAFLPNRTNLELFSGVGRLMMGSVWNSIPDRELCRIGKGYEVASYMYTRGHHESFKAIVDSRTLASIDLGGHSNSQFSPHQDSGKVFFTPVGVFHTHFRCFQDEVENCRKALISHGYVAESDSPEESLQKLKSWVGEGGCDVDGPSKMVNVGASYHKVLFYARYLQGCVGATEETFYDGKGIDYAFNQVADTSDYAASNPDFKVFMDEALTLYG